MNKEERAIMYRDYLAEEGYSPKIDDDGDVTFKAEGRRYFIIVDEKDDDFFRLLFPNFWSIENEEERRQVYIAACEATAETKVAKVFPVRDDTWASVEIFCSPPEMFKNVFERSLMALRASVNAFKGHMQNNS